MLEATPTTHEAVYVEHLECSGLIQIYFYGLPTLSEYCLTQKHNPGPKTHKLRQSRKG